VPGLNGRFIKSDDKEDRGSRQQAPAGVRRYNAMNDLIKSLEAPINPNIPADLRTGDSVKVHVRIIEGSRERVQIFPGTVIRLRRSGNNANFTVRRTASHGIGVERTFLLRSPRIDRVEITRRAHTRRAQLYFLRERTGRRATLREKKR
jgi:large subunit ribosomal protein L19